MAKASSNGQIDVPDVLGEEGRRDARDGYIANMLANLASERERIEVVRIVNGHGDTDEVPGEGATYAERFAAITEQEQKVARAFGEETMLRVKVLVESQRN